MREVHDVEDAVDQRQTERQEGVDAAGQEAADERRKKDGKHGAGPIAIGAGRQAFGRGNIAGRSAKASGATTWMSPP